MAEAPRRAGIPRWARLTTVRLVRLAGDAAAVSLAHYWAYLLRFSSDWLTDRVPVIGVVPGWELYGRLLWLIVPLWLGVFWYASRLYRHSWQSPFDRWIQTAKGVTLSTLAVLATTLLFGRLEYSRLMLLIAGVLAGAGVIVAHSIAALIDELLAGWENISPMLIVGGGKAAELLRENLRQRHPRLPIVEREDVPTVEELSALVASEGVGEVVLARPRAAHESLLALAEACENEGLDLRVLPDLLEIRLGELQFDESLGLPAYRLQHTQMTRANYLAKRAFDLAVCLVVAVVLGPLLLLIALLIRLDSAGPALFRQKRLGLRGEVFEAVKFRTMVVGAEEKVEEVKEQEGSAGFFKAKDDPRVTRLGRWLRRYSFDEFPQFLNVVAGEMSVVGPRPLAVTSGEMESLVAQFGPTAKKRMNTLPGITGLWQVSGRSDISDEQRFGLDLFYIERWSLGLDLEIVLRTLPAMLSAKGAY
ncbi:MAG: exopolysaccharide biosynthesis polyprenyl glycosylphosphotransferase [Elusimicrobia bacterium]|nr:exopolysaccharide biosynthesis polyprenyl glycosylphosphotransferase [Elusimicrobiota bacterium]